MQRQKCRWITSITLGLSSGAGLRTPDPYSQDQTVLVIGPKSSFGTVPQGLKYRSANLVKTQSDIANKTET